MSTSMYKFGLHHLNADTRSYILEKMGFNTLAAFEAEHPHYEFSLNLPVVNSNQATFLPASAPLINFSFAKYKNCLLVKHPQNLNNPRGITNEFKDDLFSRPMYWNQTLNGWIASQKDLEHLKKLGATQRSN